MSFQKTEELTMPKIKIEKNVPLPVAPTKLPPLPLDAMKVGDSFKLKTVSHTDQGTIRQRLSRYQIMNPNKRFTVRRDGEGFLRVFRVEDYA